MLERLVLEKYLLNEPDVSWIESQNPLSMTLEMLEKLVLEILVPDKCLLNELDVF